jgi:hypothetical protein
VLPRHTVSALWLWRLLVAWLSGLSLKGAAESVVWPLALETAYAIVRRVRGRLAVVRPRLCRALAPPVLQSVEHLQRVFAAEPCAVVEFQRQFQSPLMG